jgi:hypothetical protein
VRCLIRTTCRGGLPFFLSLTWEHLAFSLLLPLVLFFRDPHGNAGWRVLPGTPGSLQSALAVNSFDESHGVRTGLIEPGYDFVVNLPEGCVGPATRNTVNPANPAAPCAYGEVQSLTSINLLGF